MRATIRRYLDALERGRQFAMHDIWMIGRPGEKVPQGFIIKQIRVVILLITNIADGSVLLRASALTFATILSIVPFFAVMFYVIQTFNLGEEVYDAVQRRMELTVSKASELIPDFGDDQPAELAQIEVELPGSMMGIAVPVPPSLAAVEAQVEEDPESEDETAALRDSRNVELQNKLLESMFLDLGGSEDEDYINPVERLAELADDAARNKSGVSIAGITLLFTTVFGLMRNIEKSFNSIWGVRRTRSWYRAFSDYIMITLMLPFVATAVLGISAAMQSEQVLEQLGPLAFGVRGMQYSLVVLIFTSLYFVVPSTRVKWQYALLGGIVAV